MSTSIQHRPIELGIFETVQSARQAVDGLLAAGFTTSQITVVCSDHNKAELFHEFEHQQPAGTHGTAATLIGGTIGATLGGLTAIVTAVATGSLSLWVAGPISLWGGGVAGGLVGAMMTRGIEKELANFYQQSVIDGQILVAAEDEGPDAERSLARAAKVLAEAGARPLPLLEG